MKVSELIRLISKVKSCSFVEHGKEHDRWHSDITGKDFMIPRHPSREIPIGTVKRILKDAGIK